MSSPIPLVSVIVPARNEAQDLPECLSAVIDQEWPRDRLEVIVVDGGSEDGTAHVARRHLEAAGLAAWRVLSNPLGATPVSLNLGLAAARGDVACRVDARSVVPPEYVATCVKVLDAHPDVAVVGGAQVARARPAGGLVERGIARALRNPYATGFSRYRLGSTSGPTDTVYLGAFRTSELRSAGGWDERFATNQDYELNQRMGESGVVWFEHSLRTTYRPRSSLRGILQQYRRFGRWKAAGWLEQGVILRPRQAFILAFPPIVLVMIGILSRRGHTMGVAVSILGGCMALDGLGGEPGPVDQRALAAVATAGVAMGWWSGVIEQGGRFVIGQRLIR